MHIAACLLTPLNTSVLLRCAQAGSMDGNLRASGGLGGNARPGSAPAAVRRSANMASGPRPEQYIGDPAALTLYEQRAKLLFELSRAQVRAAQQLEAAHR